MTRPLLVGLQNPLSDDPRYALYPEPDGCAGHRLYEMLGAPWGRNDYLRAFDRVNLLRGHERVGGRGYAARLRHAGAKLSDEIVSRSSRFVVLLGADVYRAVLRPTGGPRTKVPWLAWQRFGFPGPPDLVAWMANFLALPHPSGRNRWYNVPGNREAAARELRRLAVMGDSP